MARQHGVQAVRWWPPTVRPVWLHLVVEDAPDSLPDLRSDLEHAVGCRVAVYLAGAIPEAAWGQLLVQTVAV